MSFWKWAAIVAAVILAAIAGGVVVGIYWSVFQLMQ